MKYLLVGVCSYAGMCRGPSSLFSVSLYLYALRRGLTEPEGHRHCCLVIEFQGVFPPLECWGYTTMPNFYIDSGDRNTGLLFMQQAHCQLSHLPRDGDPEEVYRWHHKCTADPAFSMEPAELYRQCPPWGHFCPTFPRCDPVGKPTVLRDRVTVSQVCGCKLSTT